MKYLYGPVESRRLVLSLGITLTPYKTCSFDCVYCQLGKTTYQTKERKEYLKTEEILEELKSWLQNNPKEAKELNYITFSGSGEPTLHINIGQLITQIKNITSVPVAVITNSSLLNTPSLRREILAADLILPSLDAVVPEVFAKIDRPCSEIKIEDVLAGLANLRREFRGKIWLEVMLVRGINDDLRYIKKLKEAVEKINPDKVQLNSPVRSTSESNVISVDKNKLKKIKEILGDKCEVI